MLDVMQIFGRAGRPQYDTEGHGTIITAHNKLRHYLSLLTSQYPIESNFKKYMTDNMNAEIVSGTITTIEEAIDWVRYTYLFIRMHKNPICYGIGSDEIKRDRELYEVRRRLVVASAEDLDKAKMIRYNPESGTLDPTDLGRTASHYYIKYDTIQKFNDLISEYMEQREIFAMIANAQEFDQLKVF
jgi:activating signal cointegrator complex subunit 3